MPCRDYYDDHPQEYFRDVRESELKKRIAFAESALCQTLAALEKATLGNDTVQADPLDYIDYKEAGITRGELEKWWTEHKKRDAKVRKMRQAANAKAEEEAKLRDAAMAKLTAEEIAAFGFKPSKGRAARS